MTVRPDRVAAAQGVRPAVVVVGGGFAGLAAVKALAGAPCDVTLIDRRNHHCFQPLLYQVAVAALTPADIAWPIRSLVGEARNVRVLMAEVTGVDAARKLVFAGDRRFGFDWLVIATGAAHAYFGHDAWAAHAPGLKRIEDAADIRRRLLSAFERAELSESRSAREAAMTFVVVGGGPTGVEMAGAIADMAREALAPDFRNIDPRRSRVVLVEAGPRILPSFPGHLAAYADRALRRRGVEVRTGQAVTEIDGDGVRLDGERLAAGAVVWAAGVAASPAAAWLGVQGDRAGRVPVSEDLCAPGHPNIFVIGDTAHAEVGDALVPGLAPAAKQMGRYVGRRIRDLCEGRVSDAPFRYRHQGDLATIGRDAAIVKLGRLELRGRLAWFFWSLIHIYFLIGLRNRLAVAFSWIWQYLSFGRRARLIMDDAAARRP